MTSVLLLSRYERIGPSSRVRHYNFIPILQREGFELTVAPLLDSDYLHRLYNGQPRSMGSLLKAYWRRLGHLVNSRRYDLIWIEKEALPWMPAGLERVFFGQRPIVIDFDDAWYLRYTNHTNSLVRRFLSRKLDSIVASASAVTTGSSALTKWAEDAEAPCVVQIPSTIDITHYPVQPLPDGPFTIGWIGTPTNAPYLALVAEPLRYLQQNLGARVRTVGAGDFRLPGLEIDCVPWREDTEARELAACHVGIAPLLDGAWERGKCGYKVIQYMAAGRPAVGSAVGALKSIIVPGKTGFLPESAEEWISALSSIAADRERNRKLGFAARQRAESFYSIERHGAKVVEVLKFAALKRKAEFNGATQVGARVDVAEAIIAPQRRNATLAE
jgi:glycosyltransferase involved in cell wall biosynthesis